MYKESTIDPRRVVGSEGLSPTTSTVTDAITDSGTVIRFLGNLQSQIFTSDISLCTENEYQVTGFDQFTGESR